MLIAGLMSGTSADGIDVAIAEITGLPKPDGDGVQIVQQAFATVPWPAAERALIFDLFAGQGTPADLCRANFRLGEIFAAAVQQVAAAAGIALASLDLIGSHGQTIWHDVTADGRVTSTLQIGEPAVIAARTGVTTVGNFRVADVAAGGQGAPLVSIFDWLLLRPPPALNSVIGGWRAAQNIGGIGNVTFLPPVDCDAAPLAFDTGPGNVLIDWAARFASNGALTYDDGGVLARQGQVHEALVTRWLEHPYYQQPPPKTTGRELYTAELAAAMRAEAQATGASDVDFVATVTALTAATIADAYARFAPGPLAQVVIAGGGAHNPVLLAELRIRLAVRLGQAVEVVTHEALGIDADAKEALTFALLAYLCAHGLPGNVPACTGAKEEIVLGVIAPGKNYERLEIRDWRLG
ncbi:MAG TPA: anhydro-N-acetylmuramic acid kinase [Chloroflexi bacterium]|nr:anhydro-N-acetylmuramic acid kinase [Chloroflexota bacterium]HHW88192.1 anhydro-N-acetylmuramic acid kinase [Chloroflexota bacterium]